MGDSRNYVSETSQFTYVWTIRNMCSYFYVESPTFTVRAMESTKWFLVFDTRNVSKFMTVSIGRRYDDGGPYCIEIKYELAILGTDGLPLIKKVDEKTFPNYAESQYYKFADCNEVFVQRRADFLPDDVLTIRCQMWRTGTEISAPEACFARTVLRLNRRTFDWTIGEFSTLQLEEKRKLIANITPKEQLTFALYVKEEDDGEYISIYPEVDVYICSMKLCLLDFERNVVKSEERFNIYRDSFFFYKFFEKERLMDNKNSLLPNDVLSWSCEIQMKPEIVWSRIVNYRDLNSTSIGVIATVKEDILIREQNETSNVCSSFSEAMASLLVEGTLSDVNLEAGSSSFLAHKCILSARSPVFKAIFSGEMKENTRNCVIFRNIDEDMIKKLLFLNIDEDTIRKLLSYIYTDSVGDLQWRGAVELYKAADEYKLLDLKKICSTLLKSNVTVNNVCSVLVLGDLHQDRELREKAHDFIRKQESDFFTSETWRSFKEENSELALETMEHIVCNIKSYF